MLKKLIDKYKLNNSGAALVMIIVVISFISITATIILYMSAMNFYMKTTDMRTKKSFYTGEKAMEEIRADLMVIASAAFNKVYPAVMADYSSSDPDSLQAMLNKEFAEEFEKMWKKKTLGNAESDILPGEDDVEKYLVDHVVDAVYGTAAPTGQGISVAAEEVSSKTFFKNTDEGTLTIKRVTVIYSSAENYMTKISSDFVIKAPQITFDMSSTDDEPIKLADCVVYSNWVKE